MLPNGISGKELARRLLAANPSLKIIFTSGYSGEVIDKEFPLQEGVNFLGKPYDLGRLARTVRIRLDEG